MKRFPINTDNIQEVGYDEVTEILEIEFNLNAVHHYYNVPIDEYVSLMKAQNIEDFYFTNVRNNYNFDAVEV